VHLFVLPDQYGVFEIGVKEQRKTAHILHARAFRGPLNAFQS